MSALSPVGSPIFARVATHWRVRRASKSSPARPAAAGDPAASVPDLRTTLAGVSDALRTAQREVTRHLQPARTVQWVSEPIPGSAQPGTRSTLAASRRVNEHAPPVQTSSAELGLVVSSSTEFARLSSTIALGLDVASPVAPSVLESSGALGLSASLSAESSVLASTDEINAGVDVDSGNLIDVDPDAVFNDEDPDRRPRFENDAQVSAGEFVVNGTSVSVFADDTIRTVLERLNSQVPGVTASFENDRVTFATIDPSEDDIVLGEDTSGFLVAVKLADATTVRGNVSDLQQSLTRTPPFTEVVGGVFTLNGVSIAVDPDADSLQAILDRINEAGAGVSAAYDADLDKVRLTTTENSEGDVVLGGDTTGFLSAAGLATANTVRGNVRDNEQVLAQTTQFAEIQSGSFTVDGAVVTVDRDVDTLQSVLAKITDSGAGVVASYDSVTDRIRLLRNGSGAGDIVVTDDDTGFLSLTGLADAVTEHGALPDDERALALTAAFGSVAAGSFSVNGATIVIDPAEDSLVTVLARINSADVGVNAVYDEATDRVILSQAGEGTGVVLGDDTSGFLEAARLSSGASTIDIDPQAAFDGTGGAAPGFEAGRTVTAGSFQVNGVEIEVRGDDSVQSILDRISASEAGVTGAFDPVTQRVALTATAAGSAEITVEDDTSGFLAAVKLDESAVSSAGQAATEQAYSWRRVERPSGRQAPTDPARAASEVAAAVDRVNEALDRIWSSPEVSALVRQEAETALRAAVSAVPNAAARGVTLERSGSAMRLYVDIQRLAAALAADAHSVRSLFEGEAGLAGALNGLTTHLGDGNSSDRGDASRGFWVSDARQLQWIQ